MKLINEKTFINLKKSGVTICLDDIESLYIDTFCMIRTKNKSYTISIEEYDTLKKMIKDTCGRFLEI